MKYIFDSSFRYEPSFDTDVRRTFQRIRQELQAQAREQAKPNVEGAINLLRRGACAYVRQPLDRASLCTDNA